MVKSRLILLLKNVLLLITDLSLAKGQLLILFLKEIKAQFFMNTQLIIALSHLMTVGQKEVKKHV